MEKTLEVEKSHSQAEIQALIRRNIVLFSGTAGAAAVIAYRHLPVTLLPSTLDTAVGRLVFTVRWNVLPVGCLFAMSAHIANSRFCGPQVNPLAVEGREKIEVHCRVLQNTLEQYVMSLSAQLAASTWLDQTQMTVIPITVTLFVVGRLLFWHGYLDPSHSRANRSRGLGMSVYPTLALMLYSIYKLATSN